MSDCDILIGIIGEYVILTVVGRCWVFGMVTKTNNRLCPNSRSNTVSLLENPNLIKCVISEGLEMASHNIGSQELEKCFRYLIGRQNSVRAKQVE